MCFFTETSRKISENLKSNQSEACRNFLFSSTLSYLRLVNISNKVSSLYVVMCNVSINNGGYCTLCRRYTLKSFHPLKVSSRLPIRLFCLIKMGMGDLRKIFYDKFTDSALKGSLDSASVKVQVCTEAFFKKWTVFSLQTIAAVKVIEFLLVCKN